MAFTPKDWKDAPDTTTPLSAAALEDLEARVSGYTDTHANGSRRSFAANPDGLLTGVITRDADGAAISAAATWPDGTVGLYTGTASLTFPGKIDSYTITYGATTYTQPTVTRDAEGAVTTRPAITVS